MKQVLSILAAAFVLFMLLAISEEWQVFAPLISKQEQPAAAAEAPPEVHETLELFDTILVHYYRFGGDRSFLERLPATDKLKAELQRDALYLAQNDIAQDMEKSTSSITSQRELADEVWEIRTEEQWRLKYLDHQGNPVNDRSMSFVVTLRYVLRLSDRGWIVAVMEPTRGA